MISQRKPYMLEIIATDHAVIAESQTTVNEVIPVEVVKELVMCSRM